MLLTCIIIVVGIGANAALLRFACRRTSVEVPGWYTSIEINVGTNFANLLVCMSINWMIASTSENTSKVLDNIGFGRSVLFILVSIIVSTKLYSKFLMTLRGKAIAIVAIQTIPALVILFPAIRVLEAIFGV